MASSWVNFFKGKKKKRKKQKNSKKLSQLRHVELANECESIKTNTYYVLAGLMTGHRAGSRACSWLFFSRWKNWASYEALRQLRRAEPATRRWASYLSLSQQGSFELARRQWAQWASKVALSFTIIYTYIHIIIYVIIIYIHTHAIRSISNTKI